MQRWNAEYEDASLILNQKEKRKQLDRLAEQIEKVQQGPGTSDVCGTVKSLRFLSVAVLRT